jgi:hypothetical protein
MSGEGSVYLLRHGDSRVYKIGRTRDTPANRKRHGLATGNPEVLTVVQSWLCDARHGEFEGLLHNTFNNQRVYDRESTEFFDFSHRDEASVVADIDQLHRQFMSVVLATTEVQDLAQADDTVLDTDDELTVLVTEHRRLQAEIKLRQFWCAAVDAKIKRRIGAHAGVRWGTSVKPSITWKTQSTTRLDQKGLKEAYPAIHAEFSKKADTRVFRVY